MIKKEAEVELIIRRRSIEYCHKVSLSLHDILEAILKGEGFFVEGQWIGPDGPDIPGLLGEKRKEISITIEIDIEGSDIITKDAS